MKHINIFCSRTGNLVILFLLTAFAYTLYNMDKNSTVYKKNESDYKKLSKKELAHSKIVKQLIDTFQKIEIRERLRHDTTLVPNPPLTIHDTLEIHNKAEIAKRAATVSDSKLRDSLIILRNLLAITNRELASLKSDIPDLKYWSGMNKKSKIDSNANVVVLPIKKTLGGIFSPSLNYMRVYNKIVAGTINSQPFVDYKITDDQLNMFTVQARTAYNFTTGTFSYGPGLEFKINRFGLNLAELFNSNNDPFKHPTTSLGARYDLYRIRFK